MRWWWRAITLRLRYWGRIAGHPVPLLIHSNLTLGEGVGGFTERECNGGTLGRLAATDVMLLAMAHADKLVKYGP